MIRTLLVTIAVVALAGAVAARVHDAPYVTYLHGDPSGAVEGLTRKAQDGDGFAAYLLGNAMRNDGQSAQKWLFMAVANGEGRAAAPFLRDAATAAGGERCPAVISLLETLARARDARAAVALGDFARDGTCGPRDPQRAAGYYLGAARLERVFAHRLESLPPLAADAPVHPLPERFDMPHDEAQRRFMAEAPALLAAR